MKREYSESTGNFSFFYEEEKKNWLKIKHNIFKLCSKIKNINEFFYAITIFFRFWAKVRKYIFFVISFWKSAPNVRIQISFPVGKYVLLWGMKTLIGKITIRLNDLFYSR